MLKFEVDFKGTKKLTQKKKKNKRNLQDFWTRIFTGYSYPRCAKCKVLLDLEELTIERSLESYWNFKRQPYVALGDRTLNFTFSCPKCGYTMRAIGKGMKLEYTFNKVIITVEELKEVS